MKLRDTALAVAALGLVVSVPAVCADIYSHAEVRQAIDSIEEHGDEFKSAFKKALSGANLSTSEKRVEESVEDLEDEVDNLKGNFKDRKYQEAKRNLDAAMLLAAPIDRFMSANYFGPEARSAWSALRDDLNVIARAYNVAPLPVVTSHASGFGSADRIGTPLTRGTARGTERLAREVRHELVMLPYYGVFDHMAFRVDGDTVTLLGQVTRPTLKSDAGNVVRDIEGVERVVNNIEVLPLSPNDDRIRLAAYRAIYGQTALNRYALQAVPPIHIIVRNGELTLEGVVANESDRNIANMQARSVPGVFSVTNNLRVE